MSDPSVNDQFGDAWRARFDRFAARGGSDATISGWSEHGLKRRLEVIAGALDHHPPEPGARICDLGAGTGIYCLEFGARDYKPVAVDYSLGMLRRAREVLADSGAEVVCADAKRLPFQDGSFGALASVGVLQHIDQIDRVFEEVSRILEPGAPVFLLTLNRWSFHSAAARAFQMVRSLARGQWKLPRHAIRRSAGDLSSRLARVGFEVEVVRGVYLFPKGFHWLERILQSCDGLRLRRRPLLLPFANALLVIARKRSE